MKPRILTVIFAPSILAIILTLLIQNSQSTQYDVSEATIQNLTSTLITALTPHAAQIRQAVLAESDSGSLLTCTLCMVLLPIGRTLARTVTNPIAIVVATKVCELLHLAPDDSICPYIVNSYGNQILFMLRQQPEGNKGTELCGILSPDCERSHPQLIDWSINLKGDKPDKVVREISPDSPNPTTFLQFTDIHLDLSYIVGMNAECGEGIPICCREKDGVPLPGKNGSVVGRAAGVFGDMKCALPKSTLNASFVDAKKQYADASYIFLTGDYIHSGVWLYSERENSIHIKYVLDLAVESFPDKKIYPITGNHEPHVVNMYVPPELWVRGGDFDLSWLYSTVMKPFEGQGHIPPEQVTLFKKNGYYSVVPETGLRFVFINSNICYDGNFWLGYDAKDPGGQLQWLGDVLLEAESKKENVYVIGHVEPGDCFGHWSGEFNRIVSRFEGIIRGMMFGHSHKPQYRVHFTNPGKADVEVTHPVSIVAGSLLTDGMNPGYSAYRVEPDGARELLRHEFVVMKLGESNTKGEAVFEKLFDSWEDFGANGLNGEEVMRVLKEIICDQKAFDKYLSFHYKGTDSLSYKPCPISDLTCKVSVISDFVKSNAEDGDAAEEFLNYVRYTDCSKGDGDGDDNDDSGAERLGGLVWGVAIAIGLMLGGLF